MPEATFLHIQTRGSSPPRVMELPGDVVRIGRGLQCEIRLGDPSLAEVECLLRRRGTSWDVQPLGPRGHLSIDGRPVEHLRALVPGVPLRVGDAWLTIRTSAATGIGKFEAPLATEIPVHPSAIASTVEPDRLGDRPYPDPIRPDPGLGARIRDNHEFRERWHKNRREQRSWEARWRAAGASLKAGQARPASATSVPPPASYPTGGVTIPSGWKRDEPPREPEPRPVETPRLLVVEPADEEDFANEFWETEAEPVAIVPEAPAEAASVVEAAPMIELPLQLESPAPPPPEAVAPAETFEPNPAPPLLIASPAPPRRPRGTRRPSSGTSRPPKVDPPLPSPEDLEWPSARVILAMAAPAKVPASSAPKPKKKAPARPRPTESLAPGEWSLPAWLGLVPAATFLVIAAVGLLLGWSWGQDDREAGGLADRLLRRDAKREDLSAEVEGMAEPSWWRTNAKHLTLRSAAIGRGQGDPEKDEKARFYLGLARNASPLEPSTRLALAGMPDARGTPSAAIASLGMSRDVLALAWTGRQLARAGKARAAMAVYRSALEITVNSDPSRATVPAFRDEAGSKRFALPNEDLVTRIVRAMASQNDWAYERWSAALPDHGLVHLATYRVLAESGNNDADRALDRLAALGDAPAIGFADVHRAAKAEGLALRHRPEAGPLYRNAIEEVADEAIRRTWWYNLAEILADPEDKAAALDALNLARAGRGDDEIGRRAGQALAARNFGKSDSRPSKKAVKAATP